MLQRVWQELDYRLDLCCVSGSTHIENVLHGKYVFTYGRTGGEILAYMRGRENFHISRNSLISVPVAIAFPRGSPLKAPFDQVIMRLASSGLLQKFESEEFEKA
ncbi:hypothetical protein SK128_017721, partial [Halocaridina rubra]